MRSQQSFVFPDTDIFSETRYPLLLCAPLRYLQPVEAAPERSPKSEPDLFMERGLCQAHTPAPLGADRERFQRLINDIRFRRDDYAAQLSALTMAALSAPETERSGESPQQIVSSLLERHGVGDGKKAKAKELEWWQARLVLAIAEILEKDEETLQKDLQLLDERELEMLRSLHGEDDPGEEHPLAGLGQIRARLSAHRSVVAKMRFQAWLKLMQAAEIPDIALWLASSQEAADQVFELYEKQGRSSVVPVLSLPLPQWIAASPAYVIQQVEQFHQKAGEVARAIDDDLRGIRDRAYPEIAELEQLLPGSAALTDRWETLLDDHFPSSSHGRSSLVFYLLPDRSIPSLLSLKTGDRDDPRHGLLAVLQG